MALLWAEGFDWIDITSTTLQLRQALRKRYLEDYLIYSSPDATMTAGRNGGSALSWGHRGQWLRYPALNPGSEHMYMGFAIKLLGPPANGFPIQVYTYNDIQFGIELSDDGLVRLTYGMPFTYFGLKVDRWYYIEFHVLAKSSGGAYEFRVNGETIAEGTGVDMAQRSWDGWTNLFQFGWSDFGTIVDDIYICDDQGSINNTFLGDVKIPAIIPDGDDTSNWSISGVGTNYQAVDETPVVAVGGEVWDDTDYLYASVLDTKDLFTYSALDSEYSGATIRGVQVTTVTRVTNPQAKTLIVLCDSNATEADVASEKLMWDEYGILTGVLETDPDTDVLWTPAGVNAAKFGIKVGVD